MTETTTLVQRDRRPDGIAVEARVRRGKSAVGRIIFHRGLHTERQENGALRVVAADALCRWFAFYSDAILSNRKQPYDQSGGSYLPLSFSRLGRRDIAGYGAFFLQREAQSGALDTAVVDDGLIAIFRDVAGRGELEALLDELAAGAGVPRGERLESGFVTSAA